MIARALAFLFVASLSVSALAIVPVPAGSIPTMSFSPDVGAVKVAASTWGVAEVFTGTGGGIQIPVQTPVAMGSASGGATFSQKVKISAVTLGKIGGTVLRTAGYATIALSLGQFAVNAGWLPNPWSKPDPAYTQPDQFWWCVTTAYTSSTFAPAIGYCADSPSQSQMIEAAKRKVYSGVTISRYEVTGYTVYTTDTRGTVKLYRIVSGAEKLYTTGVISFSKSVSCPTGQYAVNGVCTATVPPVPYVPLPDAEMDAAITDGINGIGNGIAGGVPVFTEAMMMPSVIPWASAYPEFSATATGPETVPLSDTTTSTSSPAGVATTHTVAEAVPAYGMGTVAVPVRTTTTTTDASGATSTSVATSAATQPAAPPESKPAEPVPQVEVCPPGSTASGCSPLGTADPPPADLPPLTITPVLSVSSVSGSCPAAMNFSHSGQTFSLSWQPICDFASNVRLIIIALAYLSAGIFVFASLRN